MHAAAEHALELGPRASADFLDLAAAFAEDDRFLAVAHHMDRLRDADAAVVALLPFLGLDEGGVGELLMELQEDLLTGDLGGDEALRQIGELVLGKEPWSG